MGYKENIELSQEEFEEIFHNLSFMIGSIDRVGSGFYGNEETALALLLGFKKNKMLDILARIRKILHVAMEKQLSNEQFDEFIEQEVEMWKPPYNASREELLNMLNKI